MESIEAYYSGHRYVNGMHWLAQCPLCCELTRQADVIAAAAATKETTDDNDN